MIIMGVELEALACEALGHSWKKMLALELGCSKRTVLNACKSRKGVPVVMQDALLRVMARRKEAIEAANSKLCVEIEEAA